MYIGVSFNAYDVNVKGNMYVSGLPALTSLAGLAGAMEHAIKQSIKLEDSIDVSVALFLNQLDVNPGVGADIRYQVGEGSDEMKNASLNDRLTASMGGYIFIRIQCVDEDDEDRILSWSRDPKFKHIMESMRLGGGVISLGSASQVVSLSFDECQNKTISKFNRKNIFIMEDATYLIDECRNHDEDRLDCLMRLVSFKKKKNNSDEAKNPVTQENGIDQEIKEEVSGEDVKEDNSDETYLGHIVPIAKGFASIESPQERNGVRRSNTLHVYAEPVIGLCRLRSLPSLLKLMASDEDLPLIFFRYPKSSIEEGGAIVHSYS